MPSYCTLQGARTQLMVRSGTTTDDQKLADLIEVCSQSIRDYCGRDFNEIAATLYFNGQVGKWNPTLSLKKDDLISVSTLLNGEGSTIAAANYVLLPRGEYPKKGIRLTAGNYWLAPNDSGTTCPTYPPLMDEAYAEDAIAVTGLWGFNRQYSSAWKSSTLTVSGAHNASTTTLNLSAAAAALIDVGNVLKIGTEYLLVTGPVVSTSAATALTVTRGYNGSTAAAMAGGETIYVWQMESVIELATRMTVASMYQQRSNAAGDRVTNDPIGGASIGVDIPAKAKKLLGYPYYNHWTGRGHG